MNQAEYSTAEFTHNNLDHKHGLCFNPNIAPTTDFAEELLRRTKILYDETKKNVMKSYIKYKKFYDKKAKASPLKKKITALYFSQKRTTKGQKYRSVTSHGLVPT